MMDDLDFFVKRRLKQLFPPEERDRAADLLRRYKGDTPGGRKRVHLAILKLSEGDLKKLAYGVERALLDYRDVLYAAEYHKRGR